MSNSGSISFLIVLLSLITPLSFLGQDVNTLMRQAELLERSFKDEEALKKYLEVLKTQPLHIDALCKSSELYSVLGKRRPSKDNQREYYKAGQDYARKALKINPNHSEANFAMAIAMGRMALISSGNDKIKAVKEIKTYADRCIQLDPKNFKGYHVLGKWHYEVSDLNSLEKWLVKVTYGGLPDASLDNAIINYEKSLKLKPSFLLNYLELAKAYQKKGEIKKAGSLLQQLQKLPPVTFDDFKIKGLGKKMLDEL
jgi:tetratricopeptide (TPR) repeat protein